MPRASPEYRADLNRRLRQAYLAGVEASSLWERGWPVTAEERRRRSQPIWTTVSPAALGTIFPSCRLERGAGPPARDPIRRDV
jgi:hypothetical protein